MATYFLRARHLSRGKGARATRAAAYRAGERIRDERTSEVYDHTDRRDVAYKEVILPADLAGRPDMAWTQDRATLWNAMEHAGLRRNSRVGREWLMFLPPELTPDQRSQLVRRFAVELADKYRCAIDATIHQPRTTADSRNHHAHLLMTTREVSPDGVGSRISLELGGRERHLRGLGPSRDEYLSIRERWAHVTNEALREAGLAVRVDHRSFKHQGIDREPVPTVPEKVLYAERQKVAHCCRRCDSRAISGTRRSPAEGRRRACARSREAKERAQGTRIGRLQATRRTTEADPLELTQQGRAERAAAHSVRGSPSDRKTGPRRRSTQTRSAPAEVPRDAGAESRGRQRAPEAVA
jgi:hypothetical protein